MTGAVLAPATAKLASDFHVGDRLAVPAGTLLVGEAFATQQDDRAQVVFSAIVRDGKTIHFEGWALQGTSLPTDIRRGLRKRASLADATGESYYAAAEARWAGQVVPRGLTTFLCDGRKIDPE